MQRLVRGQGSLLLETSLQVTLEQLAGATGLLPLPHHSFLPTSQPHSYWKQLAEVYGESLRNCEEETEPDISLHHRVSCFFSGDPGFYSRVLALCRALSHYLLSVNQLPSSLRIPSDKEHLITTFTCAATEARLQIPKMSTVRHQAPRLTSLLSVMAQVVVWHLLQDQLPLSVDLQWALSCLCLALQQPCVWNKLSTPEYKTQTCSLIYCLHHIILAGEEKIGTCPWKCDLEYAHRVSPPSGCESW